MSETVDNRKQRRGTVVSDRMEKTIVVEVDRIQQHPLYGKYLHRHSRLKAHDESEEATEGDQVLIEETRPQSRTKRWKLVDVVETGAGDFAEEAERFSADEA